MNITIGRGITLSRGITFGPYVAPPTPITANLILSYDAGNSLSYSGSGINFNTTYTGPNLNSYQADGVLDLAVLASGPGNSGLINSGITWHSRGTGSYYAFSGSGSYIDSSYQQDGAPTLAPSSYTFLAVARVQDFNGGAIVTGFATGNAISYFSFFNNGGTGTLGANNEFNEPVIFDSTTQYQPNTWYCVALTYDIGTGNMKLYNGGEVVAIQSGVPPIAAPEQLVWGIGGDGYWWLNGDLAVCQVWDRVLTASELAGLSDQYLARYRTPPATSSALLTLTGDLYTWTVPEGVTSISVVAVGAGGGGTQDSYSPPGGDTYLYKNSVTVQTLLAATGNTIVVDTATYPDIATVVANGSWCITGPDIGSNGAIDLVTDVATDGPNTVITIDQVVTTNTGDEFVFVDCVVAAEGGLEANNYAYNQANVSPDIDSPYGPGARALPLVTDGPYGAGGVIDWTYYDPIGGAGAGGYGIAGLAWDINRSGSWIYNNSGDYNTLAFANNNLTTSALIGIDTNNANQECSTLGTKTIVPGSKVMYSLTIDQVSGAPGYCGVGLANYSENLQNYAGAGTNSIGYYDDGGVYFDGSRIATIAPYSAGLVVDIAVDSVAKLVWFRVDGGGWNDSSADPTTDTGGYDISSLFDGGAVTVAASPWYDYASNTFDTISIATASFFIVPTGYTLVPGVANAGGTGGTGGAFYNSTGVAGTGGAGGGGNGQFENTGGGGGGTGLYGRGTSGIAGGFSDTYSDIVAGAKGGSNIASNSDGGQATAWNGGFGGYPGGGGGSAPDYYMAGNGGALAYRNNYTVTPGDTYTFVVGTGGQGQNGGGSGADGAIRIVWPGNTRTFPATNVGADTVTIPTLDITDSTFAGQSGTVTYNITSNGGSTILESGIVWGLLSDHQYSGSVDICDGGSFVEQRSALRDNDGSCGNPITTGQSGSFTQDAQVYNFGGEVIYVYAYARNAAGVAYSPTYLTWDVVPCLVEGTLITLADGSTKAIEDLVMSDTLRVWDFDNKQSTTAPLLWLKKKESTTQYNLCKFSDGSELKTVGQHRIFNKQAGKFTYPMTDDTPIGTITVKADGTEVTLTDKSVVYSAVNYYNLITSEHINCYADGILTSNRYNNRYPIADMQYNKVGRTPRNRSEFAGIADRWIDGLHLTEQTYDIRQIRKSVDAYEKNEKVDPVVRPIISAKPAPSWHK